MSFSPSRRRVLLFTSTTGYQARAFEDAGRRLGIELIYVTDRCHQLEDPWQDDAIAVSFSDERASLDAILAAARGPVHGVLAVGDRPARLAAVAAEAIGLSWHTAAGARAATNKLAMRGRLLAADLQVPWFFAMPREATLASVADRIRFPCVVKPLHLSASRGVIRADGPEELERALDRVRAILALDPMPGDDAGEVVVEGFIPGREYAIEGVVEQGALRVLAIFDKPDPLDGPYFEETIYVTPSSLPSDRQRAMAGTVAHAAAALGLRHGPIHAECRLNEHGVFVLEVAPRPIGGLCAKALRFASIDRDDVSLEELLMRHALGETLDGYGRLGVATGVMMLPVPRAGRLRAVGGLEAAKAVTGVDEIVISAKPDALLVPLPEGSSYLGFAFASGERPEEVVSVLRTAQAALTFDIAAPVPMAGGPMTRGPQSVRTPRHEDDG